MRWENHVAGMGKKEKCTEGVVGGNRSFGRPKPR